MIAADRRAMKRLQALFRGEPGLKRWHLVSTSQDRFVHKLLDLLDDREATIKGLERALEVQTALAVRYGTALMDRDLKVIEEQTMSQRPTCASCIFWHSPEGAVYRAGRDVPGEKDVRWGQCRAAAPAKGQPERLESDWCGEHTSTPLPAPAPVFIGAGTPIAVAPNAPEESGPPAQVIPIGGHRHAVELLRAALEEAERGEVVAVGLVRVYRDGARARTSWAHPGEQQYAIDLLGGLSWLQHQLAAALEKVTGG